MDKLFEKNGQSDDPSYKTRDDDTRRSSRTLSTRNVPETKSNLWNDSYDVYVSYDW